MKCDSHHQIVSLSCSESDVYRIGKDRIFFCEDGRIICNCKLHSFTSLFQMPFGCF
jgi:hypothetical protein